MIDTLRILEKAEEVRVELEGTLCGGLVQELMTVWQSAQSKLFWRRFAVDISKLKGYDDSGRALLHEMYVRGTLISAGTPASLILLREIAGTETTADALIALRRSVERAPALRRACRPSASALRARVAAH